MVSWTEFAEAEPEMAARGLEHLKIPIAYFATVRKDGSPRLHPLSPLFADGRLFVAITASAPRRHDLMRNPRYSLHTLPPDLGPDYDEFEFNVTGSARRVTEAVTWQAVSDAEQARGRPRLNDDDWLFELDIEMVLTATWKNEMVKTGDRWFPKAGVEPQPTRRVWRAP
jgi:hypothetical protein